MQKSVNVEADDSTAETSTKESGELRKVAASLTTEACWEIRNSKVRPIKGAKACKDFKGNWGQHTQDRSENRRQAQKNRLRNLFWCFASAWNTSGMAAALEGSSERTSRAQRNQSYLWDRPKMWKGRWSEGGPKGLRRGSKGVGVKELTQTLQRQLRKRPTKNPITWVAFVNRSIQIIKGLQVIDLTIKKRVILNSFLGILNTVFTLVLGSCNSGSN